MRNDNARKRVAIISPAPLAFNPRVLKEAAALSDAHFSVTVIARATEDAHAIVLKTKHGFSFHPVGIYSGEGIWKKLRSLVSRLPEWIARHLYGWLHFESRFQLGALTTDLLRAAKRVGAHYYIVHLEAGLWVGLQLMRAGNTVGVDFEDWYSEDLPAAARARRPGRLLRSLEKDLLSRAKHMSCTSRVMAEAVATAYKCEAPVVIYNAFPWDDRKSIDGLVKDRRNKTLPSVYWFSQTLGLDRGLEDLIAATEFIDSNIEIHLRGKPVSSFLEWLNSRLNARWRNHVFVHDVVANDEVLSRVAEHDIGFAGEQPYCRNKDLTVSNKILHYLLGGLAVIASDTAGQREVSEQAKGAVYLYRAGDVRDLAQQMNRLLSTPNELAMTKEASLAAARETFCWEKQAPILLESVDRAIR